MKYRGLIISTIFFTLIYMCSSCSKEQVQIASNGSDHFSIHQKILELEYALLSSEYKQALVLTDEIDYVLRKDCNLFCEGQSTEIDEARWTTQMIAKNIHRKNSDKTFDNLRILKSIIIMMEPYDDVDIFLPSLWHFEEEMTAVTSIAMDPLLGLYEWNEFVDMSNCMYDCWQIVQLHSPAKDLFQQDNIRYKNQSTYKIFLNRSIEDFNHTVKTGEWENDRLCDTADQLRQAYKDYIYSLIRSSTNPSNPIFLTTNLTTI